MIETAVSTGCGSAEIEVNAVCGVEETVIDGEVGLIGVAGRERCVYHANTKK